MLYIKLTAQSIRSALPIAEVLRLRFSGVFTLENTGKLTLKIIINKNVNRAVNSPCIILYKKNNSLLILIFFNAVNI